MLLALSDLLPRARNPFPVIVGTSAGAVAASVLAAEAPYWHRAVAGLERVWGRFRSEQVFRSDPIYMLRSGLHWILSLASGGMLLSPPQSLLNNNPLRELLGAHIEFAGVRRSIARGHLQAFAICATSYLTGYSVSFFDAHPSIAEWTRVQHVGRRTELTLDHVLASAAIPMLFPPMRLGQEYFGDGAMRQVMPLSPAIHLGANRLLIIGARAQRDAGVMGDHAYPVMPSPGEIFGYMLDTLFTDQIYGDLEQLERINQLVRSAPEDANGLKAVETLMLAPSVDPREIAARHADEMPASLRTLLRVIGGRDASNSQLASYLVFESGYTRALIELGYRDAMQVRDVLLAFMAGEKVPPVNAAPVVAQAQ